MGGYMPDAPSRCEHGVPGWGACMNCQRARVSALKADRDALREQLRLADEVAVAGARAMKEIRAQRGMWPGEVDTLDEALEAYRKARVGR